MVFYMQNYEIVPIAEEHIEGFHAAVDSVAKEHQCLAFLDAPPLETTRCVCLRKSSR